MVTSFFLVSEDIEETSYVFWFITNFILKYSGGSVVSGSFNLSRKDAAYQAEP